VTIVLGLAIGANTAIFSVVYGVLLRALPYSNPDRLVVVLRQSLRERGPGMPVAPANFYDWREQATAFEDMTATEVWGPTLTGQDAAEQLPGLRASANLFAMLGVEPLLGRGFSPADEQPGGNRVVVLGYGLWQRRFGGRTDIIGQALRLDGNLYTVTGVMPQGFGFPTFWAQRAELWTPLFFAPDRAQQRTGSSLRIFARLKPGAGVAQAQAEMSAISARLAQEYPATNSDDGAIVEFLSDKTVANVRPTIAVVAGAAGLLLLIACVNVANLLLARAKIREREVAVRRALGASRGDVVRQLLCEGIVLSAAAGLVGLLLGSWGIYGVLASIPDTAKFSLPRREAIAMDGQVLSFTLVLSVLTAVLFSLAPALQSAKATLTSALREHGRGRVGSGGGLQRALVVGEVSLALMLLTAPVC
jgi:predicted permease